MSFEFRAGMVDFDNRLVVVACHVDEQSRILDRARPIAFEFAPKVPGEIHEPTFSLEAMQAQSLINALWKAGLRPSGFKNEPAPPLIEAKDRHIADLRAIAFKGLEITP